jgi:hypothetical protein
MYWIEWHMAQMRQDPELEALNRLTFPFGVPRELRCTLDEKSEKGATSSGVMDKWQDFENPKKSSGKSKRERNVVMRSRTRSTASSSETRGEEM